LPRADGDAPHWEQRLPSGAGCGRVTALLRDRVTALQELTAPEALRLPA
jgi:hypothetical protein